ncbi:MAG: hypothetical protein FWD78_14990 [Treponema sp.]|nr:hypothetical protein [Treponema sp.]
MQKNLPALSKQVFFLLYAIISAGFLWGQEQDTSADTSEAAPVWYRSNASGMAIEYVPSGLAALRNEYCLSVKNISASEIPSSILPYFNYLYSCESRILYENGSPYRQQWIFHDQKNITRLNASGLVTEDNPEAMDFIEVYNENRFIIEERQFTYDSGGNISTIRITNFTYSGGLLIKTENRVNQLPAADTEDAGETAPDETAAAVNEAADETMPAANTNTQTANEAAYVDLYRYTRSASLRTIERTYITDITGELSRLVSFPAVNPGMSKEPEFENPGLAYSSLFPDGFVIPADSKAVYTTDSKGRVITETRFDENGNTVGKLVNTWTGDRLDSVYWKSADEDKLTQYEYDDKGNRILERNFNNGVLERVVRTDGTTDTEELYIDGKLMLRAVWEEGRKVSEERVRQPSARIGQ